MDAENKTVENKDNILFVDFSEQSRKQHENCAMTQIAKGEPAKND